MDVKFVEGLVAIFERSGLAEIEYQENGSRIRLTRTSGQSPVHVDLSPASDQAATVSSPAPRSGPVRNAVKAGLSGMIYMAPTPDQPPFVALGDAIEEGQTLGIVEAMKMLSPIESEWSGRLVEVCVTDGTPVEAGTPLFIIEAEA